MADVTIDTGDVVRHIPSSEHWIVAYVDGDRLAWAGWPQGTLPLAEFELVEKALPKYRDTVLAQMLASQFGPFVEHARQALGSTPDADADAMPCEFCGPRPRFECPWCDGTGVQP